MQLIDHCNCTHIDAQSSLYTENAWLAWIQKPEARWNFEVDHFIGSTYFSTLDDQRLLKSHYRFESQTKSPALKPKVLMQILKKKKEFLKSIGELNKDLGISKEFQFLMQPFSVEDEEIIMDKGKASNKKIK